MFKALLKTIPSLSGNMKLSCFVEGYKKLNSNIYQCNVKKAKLTTIAHKLYDKNIYVNLNNNSFEYDVNRFYSYYFDVFYKSSFNYSKTNIPIIDFTDINDNFNVDFNFGCKRISYSKYDNQLAFFAPIYIEGPEDIKNKYFKIKCKFNKIYTLTKELIIPISNLVNDNIYYDEDNYLANYLDRYANKIDNKVIYMSDDYKNIYYGIDLLHGGFIKVEDNISKNLYNKYYTINDFDAIINGGFKRNSIMMKQIIPLSFYFNPNRLLSKYEKKIYNNAELTISGEWYDSSTNTEEEFYNFSDNYNSYNESVYKLTSNNEFEYLYTNNNIMNMNYPAFKEASSENYKFINTVIKNYNRWKLKYSTDNYPYIINSNFAFSENQNSLYTYKEFPLKYNSINAICKLYNNEYNLIFDLVDIYDNNYKLINSKNKYYDLFNKCYINNFFNLFTVNDAIDNELYYPKYNNIFENDELWCNVNEDNKVYYKGILYDFNLLYTTYTNAPKIDKFSIILNPEINTISTTEYHNKYNIAKNVLSYNYKYFDNDNNLSTYIYKYDFINERNSYISNNKIVIKDTKGDYIDINSYYLNTYNNSYYANNINNNILSNLHYDDSNLYLDINELLLVNDLNNTNINLYNILYNQNYDKIIDGYKVINICYINNIISEIYQELIDIYNLSYKYNDSNIIYREYKFLENESIYWAYDNIYFSIYPNKTKYKLLKDISLLFDKSNDTKIVLYYKSQFINYNDFINNNVDINVNTIISKINKYYISSGLYENQKIYTDLIFKLFTNSENNYYNTYKIISKENEENNIITVDNSNFNENCIFIDPYNLDLVKTLNNFEVNHLNYNLVSNNIHNLSKILKVNNCYCKFLNLDHIYKYFEKLYLDNKLESNVTNIINTIYIKVNLLNHIISNDISTNLISTSIKYIPIKEFFNNNDNITLQDILHYIEFNDNGYFFFNTRYFEYIKNYSIPYYIKNFEIVFKKDMYILNAYYYELILELNKKHKFKDLYLYKLSDYTDYKFEYIYNTVNINNTSQNIDEYIKFNKDNIIELSPYFNSIYDENKSNIKIYNDYFFNNIITSKDIKRINISNSNVNYSYILFKKSNITIDYLVYYPVKTAYDPFVDFRYSLYKQYNNNILSAYDFCKNYIINSNNIKLNQTNVKNYSELSNEDYNKYNAVDIIKYLYEYNDGKIIKDYIDLLENYSNNNNISTINLFTCNKDKQLSYTNQPDNFYKRVSLYKKNTDKNLQTDLTYHYAYIKYAYKDKKELFEQYSNDFFNELPVNFEDYDNNTNKILITVRNNLIRLNPNLNTYTTIYYTYSDIINLQQKYGDQYINVSYNNADINIDFSYYLEYDDSYTYDHIYGNDYNPNKFDCSIKTTNKTYNMNVDDINIDNYINTYRYINNYDNLITYNYNGKNYGFYMLHTEFDNTNNTLNIINDNLENINIISYINNVNVHDIKKYQTTYLHKMYHNIIPYINNVNIVKELLNNVHTLIQPKNYKLTNIYNQYANNNLNNITYSYNIFVNKKKSSIELTRYFDFIQPYLYQTNKITSYYLYYKNTNKYIEENLKNKNIQYIMYSKTNNIYDTMQINYFDKYNLVPNKFIPLEYKFFNNNKFINLSEEIIINYKNGNLVPYSEIIEKENDHQFILNLFIDYLSKNLEKNIFDNLSENEILFLYKKYKVNFSHIFKKIDNNIKLYSLTIKFKLL